MTTRTLYALRTTANGYVMAKFEDGVTFDVVATYTIEFDKEPGEFICDCPSHKHPCKHINMLDKMSEHADTDQFYDPKDGSWHTPLSPMGVETDPEAMPDGLERDEALEATGLNVTVIDENTDFSQLKLPEEPAANRPHPALGTIKRRI